VYVAIDDHKITKVTFLRRAIAIKDIRGLRYDASVLGLIKGIKIEYQDTKGIVRNAILPSITTFGTKKTAEMISILRRANPDIKVDPRIAHLTEDV
jgi:hypothetical protein